MNNTPSCGGGRFCVRLHRSVGLRKSGAGASVAATVNGRPIYYAEVEQTYKSQFPGKAEGESEDQVQLRRLEVLRSLIDNEIMLQRAEKAGGGGHRRRYGRAAERTGAPYTKEEFDKQLKSWGLTLDELKARIRKDESVKKLFNKEITSKINISDADVDELLQRQPREFQSARAAGAYGADCGDTASRSECAESEERQSEERRRGAAEDRGDRGPAASGGGFRDDGAELFGGSANHAERWRSGIFARVVA